jgi:hypothetical protein
LSQPGSLPPEELERIRVEAYQLTQLAAGYACPLLIGPPPDQAQVINSGSGVVVELSGSFYLITAAHILDDTRKRRQSDPSIAWHLASNSDYVTFDPDTRFVLHDSSIDLLILHLTEAEAAAPAKTVCRPPYWPPQPLNDGEYIFVCGYPGVERIQVAPRYWSFAPACIGGAVGSVSPGRFGIHFDRANWMTYKEGVVPSLGSNLGSMSGGPIFAFRGILLTLVGVVAEHTPGFDILYGAGLDGVSLDRLA